MSGSATSAAETVSGNARDVRDVQAQMNTANLGPSTMPQGAQDYRSEFIAAGGGQRVNPGFFDSRNVVSPQELALARAYDPAAFRASRRSGIMDFFTSGGLLGNIIRSIGQKFGLGKTYNQPTYDMSRYSNLPLGGSLTFENLDIRDKFDRRNTGIMQNIDPYKYSIEPQPVNLKTPQYFENVPYQEPDFYSDAMADAYTTPTMGQYGLNLMQLNTLKNAGYSNSQIEEAVEKGYADELVRDIKGPIGIV